MSASYQIRSILTQAEDAMAPSTARPRSTAPASTGSERGRARKSSFEDNILNSVRTVERAVENFGALRENCLYFKEMANDLRRDLEEEKAESKAANKHVDELEHHVRSERDRAARLEELLAASEQKLRDLERELESVRGRTEHLVETISRLVSAEADAHSGHDDDHYRHAA